MLFMVIQGVPVWVWPLLAFLLWYGLRATRERETPVWPFYAVPLVGLLSVKAVLSLGQGALVWAMFGLAYAAGAGWGYARQRGLVLSRGGGRVTLAGEWMTLALMMLVFWMNFAGGVAQAVAPDIHGSLRFALLVALIGGAVGGSFLGRSLRVVRDV